MTYKLNYNCSGIDFDLGFDLDLLYYKTGRLLSRYFLSTSNYKVKHLNGV